MKQRWTRGRYGRRAGNETCICRMQENEERKIQLLAAVKGILDTETTQNADTPENIARYVEDRIEKKVNKIKWNYTKHLKGFEYGEMVKRIPNVCTQ